MKKNNSFYVYALLDPRKPGIYKYEGILGTFTHEPFYVGKGYKQRYSCHIKEKEDQTGNLFKYRKIKNIEKVGLDVIAVKIMGNLSNREALEKEQLFIAIIGRKNLLKGPLTNLTDGGEGSTGYKHSTEAKNLIIASNKKRGVSIQTKEKISLGVKNSGFVFSEELKRAQSVRVSGKNNYFYGKRFYKENNHNWGKQLSESQRNAISKHAKTRTGNKNSNCKFKYCIYDISSKNEHHDILDLTSINVVVKRKLHSINRLGNIVILKKPKEEQGCSCSVLKEGYKINDVPIEKHRSIGYLLRNK